MASVKFKVVEGAAPTSATTQDLTVSGFGTPKAAIFFLTHATALDTMTNHAVIGIGVTDGTTHMSLGGKSEHNRATSDAARSQQQGEPLHKLSEATDTLDGVATFDSFITDGVRIDWTGNPPASAFRVVCVLIGGDDVTANVGVTNVGASTNIAHGVSAIPDLMFFLATTAADDGISTSMTASFGVYQYDGAAKNYNATAFEQDAAGTTVTASMISNNRMISSLSNSAVSRDFNITAQDSTNVTVTRQTGSFGADPMWLALSFGSSGIKTDMGSFDIPTSTGTASYTNGDSFTPQFCMFVGSDLGAENTYSKTQNPCLSIGVVDDTNEYGVAIGCEDAVTTTNTRSVTANKALYNIDIPATGEIGAIGTVHTGGGSIDADGVTVDWTTTAYSTVRKGFWLQVEAEAAATRFPYESIKQQRRDMKVLLTR